MEACRRMIRAPRLILGNSPSPIHRLCLLPTFHLRPPRAAIPTTQTLAPARCLASSPHGSVSLPRDPAATAAAPAGASRESDGYDEAAEFLHVVAGADGRAAAGGMAPGAGKEEPRELPEELAKGVVCLECETSPKAVAAGLGRTCRVYVVGTAHLSQESCDQVKAVINYLKPQAVFLELCRSRVSVLTQQNLKVPRMNEMIDVWKKKKMNSFGIVYSWCVAKVARQLEVLPGAEFRVAYEEARSYGGKVLLGDRPVQVTLSRTWGKMSLWYRAKFLCYIFFGSIFLPSRDVTNKMLKNIYGVGMLALVIEEMSKQFPSLMETLLHERDLYMSSTLLTVAREHSSVVAVVGKAHVAGIKKNWQQPIQLKSLLEVPAANQGASKVKVLASIGVLSGVVVASAIYLWG